MFCSQNRHKPFPSKDYLGHPFYSNRDECKNNERDFKLGDIEEGDEEDEEDEEDDEKEDHVLGRNMFKHSIYRAPEMSREKRQILGWLLISVCVWV